MRYSIHVIPRSSKNLITEMGDGTLKIKLTAAPVDNEANIKLVKLLSEHFDVAKSKIKIVSGLTSKNKIIEVSS
ncbi:MAG: DUF167 domain-containing protein [Patescibacteria group bacterium]